MKTMISMMMPRKMMMPRTMMKTMISMMIMPLTPVT